jgi:hypothetical protein
LTHFPGQAQPQLWPSSLTGIGWLAILTRSTTNGQLKGLKAFGV